MRKGVFGGSADIPREGEHPVVAATADMGTGRRLQAVVPGPGIDGTEQGLVRAQDVGVGQRHAIRELGDGLADFRQECPVLQLLDASEVFQARDVAEIAAFLEVAEDIEHHMSGPSRSAR
ncbi:hypothetical protein [Methylobacterium sp. WL18]|uniref:hypothetical protein n=1 Tax=Methylobacterium sp. WL18 TaxID=2603897 RepID=UPI001AEE4379|nr:hypothetical protein [Methylobacterium sp. WL18]